MLHSEKVVTKVHTESTWNGVERRRVEQVVETLATLRGRGESISEVAHDARNMVTALGLYCDLLEEPGVLATAFTHYAHELRLVAAASRRLVEKLVSLDANAFPDSNAQTLVHADAMHGTERESAAGADGEKRRWGNAAGATSEERNRRWDLLPALPITNLAAELLANRNLLAALAGPSIALTVDADGGAQAGASDGRGPDPAAGESGKERGRGHARDRTRIAASTSASGSANRPGRGDLPGAHRGRQRAGHRRGGSRQDFHLRVHLARQASRDQRRSDARL